MELLAFIHCLRLGCPPSPVRFAEQRSLPPVVHKKDARGSRDEKQGRNNGDRLPGFGWRWWIISTSMSSAADK